MNQAKKIAITGSSGLVGQTLIPFLKLAGFEIAPIVRQLPAKSHEIYWAPREGSIETHKLEGLYGVIHLAGENIADGRWNAKKKERILQSRVQGTQLLAHALTQLEAPPKVMISASASGYYGDQGDELLTESSPAGQDFLAEVCQQWEEASQAVTSSDIRLVNPRIAMVLSRQGGALERMVPPFQLGLGAKLGGGSQYMSWIVIDDLVKALLFCLRNEDIQGPVNFSSPAPVTNADFTKILAQVLHRPALFKIPKPVIKAMFGEMAETVLLGNHRLIPRKLLDHGFAFDYVQLSDALRHVLL